MPVERGPRTILGRRMPDLHGYWILDYLPPLQRSKTEFQPSRADKILQAIEYLCEDGRNGATAEQIVDRVKKRYPSKFPPYQPKWNSAFYQLRETGDIVGMKNPDYEEDSDLTRLYRRATEAEKKEFARNRRNDLSRAV